MNSTLLIAIKRTLRAAGAAALSAFLVYLFTNVGDFEVFVPDASIWAVLTGVLAGLEKFLRDKGILPTFL